MENSELIKKIHEELKEIAPGKSASEVHGIIQSVTRSVNRLSIEDKKSGLLLRKLATDLMQVYSSEIQYFNMNKPGPKSRITLSDSFFQSTDIIRKEIFKLLDKNKM